MSTPRRIQLSRAKGWKLTDQSTNYVIVDRSGVWGNPWTIRPAGKRWLVLLNDAWPVLGTFDTKTEARVFSVDRFRTWLTDDTFAELHPSLAWDRAWVLGHLGDLAGKDLCCWCDEGPCHCDVYFELLNARAGGTS
jgi:hypothetical protein